MREAREGVDNCRRANVELDNSTSHSSCIFIGQFKRKPLESCEKYVKILSKSGEGTTRSTVIRPIQNMMASVSWIQFEHSFAIIIFVLYILLGTIFPFCYGCFGKYFFTCLLFVVLVRVLRSNETAEIQAECYSTAPLILQFSAAVKLSALSPILAMEF